MGINAGGPFAHTVIAGEMSDIAFGLVGVLCNDSKLLSLPRLIDSFGRKHGQIDDLRICRLRSGRSLGKPGMKQPVFKGVTIEPASAPVRNFKRCLSENEAVFRTHE